MKIEDVYKIGRYSIKIEDIENKNYEQIRNAQKELLRQAVNDEEVLDVVTEEQNIQKIKHRIQLEYDIKSQNGQTITKIQTIGKKTPVESIQEIKSELKKGQEIRDTHANTIQNIKRKGYQWQQHNNGKIERIDLTITFRKAGEQYTPVYT